MRYQWPADLPADDPRQWAVLFTRARKRKGWSYVRLATESGVSERSVYTACLTGRCYAVTALKLAVALGLIVELPPAPRVLTAKEAQSGQQTEQQANL